MASISVVVAIAAATAFALRPAPPTVAHATSLGVTSGRLTLLASGPPGDLLPPQLVALEMFDDDTDGRVDRLVADFDDALAAPYSGGTAGWTLSAAPSAATLGSVSVSGSTATLLLTEGTAPPDTGIGAFTVALAQTPGGVRDATGNLSAFAATAPIDRAAPVPVAVTASVTGTIAGRLQTGDELSITFSEALAPSSVPATTTVYEHDPQGNADPEVLFINGVTSGAPPTGGNYVANNRTVIAPSAISLADGDRTVRITITSCTCGDALTGVGTFTYTAPATITDTAANAATGSFTTAATFRLF